MTIIVIIVVVSVVVIISVIITVVELIRFSKQHEFNTLADSSYHTISCVCLVSVLMTDPSISRLINMHVSRLLMSVGLVGVGDISAVTPTVARSSSSGNSPASH